MTLRPHFKLPFRFATAADGTRHASEVEQDSFEDVEQCVEVIIAYPLGFRIDLPGFGLPDQVFEEGGGDLGLIDQTLDRWEPRARVSVTQQFDSRDSLISYIRVEVEEAGASV